MVMTIDSPIGTLTLREVDGRLSCVAFGNTLKKEETQRETQVLYDAAIQLGQYFAGERQKFDLPLVQTGTPFQQTVWQALCAIPYGSTCTYGEIAQSLGKAKAYRAVGLANNKNPLAIIVPCHRVVGADGSLTGYAGGLEKKQFLLDLEHNTARFVKSSSK